MRIGIFNLEFLILDLEEFTHAKVAKVGK